MTFDLTSSEALQLIRNDRNEEHTEQLFIAARPNDCTFNGTIKSFGGKEIVFECKGDILGPAYIHEVIKVDGGYKLEYWGDSFKRILPDNSSYSQERLGIDDYTGRCEQALHNLWIEENAENEPWKMDKTGLLQSLINSRKEITDKFLTNRERKLVATIVQWFGTNCGRAFLETANYNAAQLGKQHDQLSPSPRKTPNH